MGNHWLLTMSCRTIKFSSRRRKPSWVNVSCVDGEHTVKFGPLVRLVDGALVETVMGNSILTRSSQFLSRYSMTEPRHLLKWNFLRWARMRTSTSPWHFHVVHLSILKRKKTSRTQNRYLQSNAAKSDVRYTLATDYIIIRGPRLVAWDCIDARQSWWSRSFIFWDTSHKPPYIACLSLRWDPSTKFVHEVVHEVSRREGSSRLRIVRTLCSGQSKWQDATNDGWKPCIYK